MRFRLRYQHHDLELTEGEFAIGRSAACQLSLDDPLVSRRHAVLFVTAEAVSISDQKSRNGVVVNDARIDGPVWLGPGDRIVIGSQELTLIRADSDLRITRGVSFGNHTLPRMPSLPVLEEAQATPTGRPPPMVPTASASPVLDSELDPTMVRRAQAFKLLSGVAEKALAMGRAEEAERLLAGPLAELIEACRAGKRPSPTLVDTVARFAAKLATSTTKGAWADYVIELYFVLERPCPAPVVDELNNAVRRVTALDLVRLRAYLALLHEKQAALGPADRFLVQRIEGLERLAALR